MAPTPTKVASEKKPGLEIHSDRDDPLRKASGGKVSAAFREVNANEPAVVAKTRAKSGEEAARKQTVAIALSKARAAGARIPRKEGGPVGCPVCGRFGCSKHDAMKHGGLTRACGGKARYADGGWVTRQDLGGGEGGASPDLASLLDARRMDPRAVQQFMQRMPVASMFPNAQRRPMMGAALGDMMRAPYAAPRYTTGRTFDTSSGRPFHYSHGGPVHMHGGGYLDFKEAGLEVPSFARGEGWPNSRGGERGGGAGGGGAGGLPPDLMKLLAGLGGGGGGPGMSMQGMPQVPPMGGGGGGGMPPMGGPGGGPMGMPMNMGMPGAPGGGPMPGARPPMPMPGGMPGGMPMPGGSRPMMPPQGMPRPGGMPGGMPPPRGMGMPTMPAGMPPRRFQEGGEVEFTAGRQLPYKPQWADDSIGFQPIDLYGVGAGLGVGAGSLGLRTLLKQLARKQAMQKAAQFAAEPAERIFEMATRALPKFRSGGLSRAMCSGSY